jgi:hypothetical protein
MKNYFVPAVVYFLKNFGQVFVNYASKEELTRVSGVGTSRAEKFLILETNAKPTKSCSEA